MREGASEGEGGKEREGEREGGREGERGREGEGGREREGGKEREGMEGGEQKVPTCEWLAADCQNKPLIPALYSTHNNDG